MSRERVRDLVAELSDGSLSKWNLLIEVDKLCEKDSEVLEEFTARGGVTILFRLVEVQTCADKCQDMIANWCLNDHVREQIIEAGHVKTIAKWLCCSESEGVRNRACRGLANIALTSQGAKAVRGAEAIEHIVTFLRSSETVDSKVAALRAVRILGQVPECRKDLIRYGAPAAATKFLPYKILQEPAIRALDQLTQPCSRNSCGSSARQIKDAGGFKSFEDLLKSPVTAVQESALKALINLSEVKEVWVHLGEDKIVSALVRHLCDYKLSQPSYGKVFTTACCFTEEAEHRAQIRESGGLAVLVQVLADKSKEELWMNAVCAILQFSYHEPSLTLLWELGLVSTLFVHINEYTKAHGRNQHSLGKFNFLSDTSTGSIPKKTKMELGKQTCPVVCNSVARGSSMDAIKGSHTYLPPHLEQPQLSSSVVYRDREERQLDMMLAVLELFTFKHMSQYEQRAAGLFNVLMCYMQQVPNPLKRAEAIMKRITSNEHSFEDIVCKGGVVKLMENMTKCGSTGCGHCQVVWNHGKRWLSNLKRTAESDYGKGVLIRGLWCTLHKGLSNCWVLSIPHIVCDKAILHQLLIKHSGLDILLAILKRHSEGSRKGYFRQAAHSLAAVCKSMSKEPDIWPATSQSLSTVRDMHCCLETFVMDVHLELDDGSRVCGNRLRLSGAGSYFAALLSGQFIEADQNIISFHCVLQKPLSIVIHFLHGCAFQVCPLLSSELPVSVLLDVLELSDYMLLDNLKSDTEIRLRQNMRLDSIFDVYSRVLLLRMTELCKFCLWFLLTKELNCARISHILMELLAGEHGAQALDDIGSLVRE